MIERDPSGMNHHFVDPLMSKAPVGQQHLNHQQLHAALEAGGFLPPVPYLPEPAPVLAHPVNAAPANFPHSTPSQKGLINSTEDKIILINRNKKVNKRKICEAPGCPTQASFKYPDDAKFRYCAKHKLQGMSDFHSRKCEHENCETIASFNIAGEKRRRFCKLHAEPGMQVCRSRACASPPRQIYSLFLCSTLGVRRRRL